MKCQSVACLWSGGAPTLDHRVTATAVLNQPATLYTGGSDGSIIWWNISEDHSNQEIWPMAILFGHTAAVADLEICMPTIGGREMENSSNGNSIPSDSVALISACTDGVLCLWSRGSGHCKRRRKMPPWVGTPSNMASLPMSQRYVCIACCCVDAVLASNHHTAESAGVSHICNIQNESIINKEAHYKRMTKSAIVIVDSCTLNIIQTVFHGNLAIGPLRYIQIVPSVADTKKQSVIIADTAGKVQSIPIVKESDPNGGGGNGLQRSSLQLETSFEVDSSRDEVEAVSVATHGKLLALVFRTCCIFKSITTGLSLGEISFLNSYLYNEDYPTQTYVRGGLFLQNDYNVDVPDAWPPTEEFREKFAVWSNSGAAVVYMISISDNAFKFVTSSKIPAVSHPSSVKVLISFCQLNHYLLRIESICFNLEALAIWRPLVSIWSLCQPSLEKLDILGKLTAPCEAMTWDNPGDPYSSIMLGEGGFIDDCVRTPFSLSTAELFKNKICMEAQKVGTAENSLLSRVSTAANLNVLHRDYNDGCLLKGQIVSSSLILSEGFYVPYAVIYGYCSGEIEVVRFEKFFQELNISDGCVHHNFDPHTSEFFSGHTSAVLCLAAHHMVATSNESHSKQVLVSGSMDCTIRIWDLVSGSIMFVMHHHVAPVRQIILPAPWTVHPWNDCFLSVGEDSCIALVSLETLQVERMFPGHPSCPATVVWDSVRGYIACLCQNITTSVDAVNVLYLWDVKTGARERVIRGTASHSMFDHFCRDININSITGNIWRGTTSASSLLLSAIEDAGVSRSNATNLEKGVTRLSAAGNAPRVMMDMPELEAKKSKGQFQLLKADHDFISSAANNTAVSRIPQPHLQNKDRISCSCPFPGIACLKFDLSSLMDPCVTNKQFPSWGKQENTHFLDPDLKKPTFQSSNISSDRLADTRSPPEEPACVKMIEECVLRFSLSFLHLWGVDHELDTLLVNEMKLSRPETFFVASGLSGDRGSLTFTFPGRKANLEIWRSSSEFCAMRSLTMVSLAQRMISLCRSSSTASSALAAFYTRNFAEKVPDIKPPLLQLLVSFWQDSSEHVRMAARSLFHCAASRAIPISLCGSKVVQHALHSRFINCGGEYDESNEEETSRRSTFDPERVTETLGNQEDQSTILAWLESFEMQDWISCIGGTSQDAMASHIIVAAALAVWYPSLVKPSLATLVVHSLIKLVMAMNDEYSSTAAELLAEGMESTWKACIGPEIPRLVGDIFFQIECVSGPSAKASTQNPSLPVAIQETLVGILLPSLAMADITGFLNVIERQIWATASDSPVHLVALMTLVRVVRSSPKLLAPHLDKAVNFVLQTMDHGNSVMRKTCLQSSMQALKEVVRVFPMTSFNESLTRLAVGDAIGDILGVTIRVYDMQSMEKIKVLDASGPPGLPSLLGRRASEAMITTAIAALSFSPDGEGLVAFSEHGLMIRWWSLGTAWWEKLTRNLIPVQCTKLIFVPPWEGFSPNSSRSSVIAGVIGSDQIVSQERMREIDDTDNLKLLIQNLDLSYRLEWVDARKVVLKRHGQELGSFQL